MIETLGNLGDFIGGIGVVLTLIYLAVQVRQNTRRVNHNSELIQASAELETAKLLAEYHGSVANSPDLARLWDAMADTTSLTREDRARLVWMVAQYFYVVEGLYRQRQRGFLPTESWLPYERALAGLLQVPFVADWFRSKITPLSDEFCKYSNSLITAPPDDAWKHQAAGDVGTHDANA